MVTKRERVKSVRVRVDATTHIHPFRRAHPSPQCTLRSAMGLVRPSFPEGHAGGNLCGEFPGWGGGRVEARYLGLEHLRYVST